MINRILIRIKVIQILYSFLLVEKKFTLPDQPSAPTKEKRFAYALYLDLLYLLIRIADRIEKRGGEKPLGETQFIRRISIDDKIKSLVIKYGGEPFSFAPVLDNLTDKVKESGIYRNWLKKSEETDPGNIRVWKEIFDIIIMNDDTLRSLLEVRPNYTLRGVERAKSLMNETFVNFMASQDNIGEAQNKLKLSLDMAHELYYRLLTLPVDLTDLYERVVDERRHKYIVSQEDLNPNMRLVDNQLVDSLRKNERIKEFADKRHISWMGEDPVMLNNLLKAILNSDIYKEYETLPATDYHTDAEFWRNIFKHVIFNHPDFLESLEDKSVFWNDDLEIIGTFLLKTFKKMDEKNGSDCVMEQFKDEEDSLFGPELLRFVWFNKDNYRDMINAVLHSGSWDAERLAFMDVVILETAIAEILNYPKIPLTASINEYIELAKSYSTGKSGQFVNGILGAVVKRLREEGKLRGK